MKWANFIVITHTAKRTTIRYSQWCMACHVMIITSSCFDRLQAVLWFIKATELAPNDPKAFYNLGRLAIEEQNFRKAVKLFELAAHNGLTLAAFNMAVAYYKGSGADQGKRVLSFNRKR